LEGDSQVDSCAPSLPREKGAVLKKCSCFEAEPKERSGLAGCDFPKAIGRRGDPAAELPLFHSGQGQFLHDPTQGGEQGGPVGLDGFHRLGQKEVTRKNGPSDGVPLVESGDAAAEWGFVNNVVVNEACRVNQFSGRCDCNGTGWVCRRTKAPRERRAKKLRLLI
jgi:hypothetical protein